MSELIRVMLQNKISETNMKQVCKNAELLTNSLHRCNTSNSAKFGEERNIDRLG